MIAAHQQATPDSPTCVAEHPVLSSDAAEVVKACAVNNDSSCSSSSTAPSLTTAQDWYDQGEHVWYDPVAKQIVDNDNNGVDHKNGSVGLLRRVFCRVVHPSQPQSPCTPTPPTGAPPPGEDLQERQRWMTFLPGTPEGSYGFHQVEEALRFPDDQGCASSDNRGRCDTDATELSQDSVDTSQAADDNSNTVVYNRQLTQVTQASSRSYDERKDSDSPQAAAAQEEEDQQEEPEDSNSSSSELSRLYLDYLGQGDSDHLYPPLQKRRGSNGDDHEDLPRPEPTATATASSTGSGSPDPTTTHATIAPSSTTQRADLVEAHWHALGIQRTVVASVGDASSLVVMELLHRQRARLQAGTPFPKIMHVLSVNGKHVAKTRQTSQLPAMTQLLRSERMGAALAAKAQRSDFTMSQCLQPYLKGLNQHVNSHHHPPQNQKGAAVGNHHAQAANKQQHIRHVRQQVMDVVRRHGEAAPHTPHAIHSLQDYARTVDDHLQEQHKYRWHLPRLFHLFCQDQGITFQLATTHRHALKQVQLVRDSLVRDYDLDYEDLPESCPGIQYDDWTKNNHGSGHHLHHQVSSTAFLLGSSREQLQPLLQAIHRLVNEEIPLSNNTHHGNFDLMKDHSRRISFDDDEEDFDDHSDYHHHPHHEDDSWHMQMSESDLVALEMTNADHQSQDTRLEKEIVFDADDASLTDDYNLEWAI